MIAAAQWTQLWNPLFGPTSVQPMRRSAHAQTVFNDTMYVFGGISSNLVGDNLEFNDTWGFNLVEQQWTELPVGPTRPSNRFHHAGALHSNSTVSEFIVFGGISLVAVKDEVVRNGFPPVVQYNDVWRLSLTANPPEWTMDPILSNSSEVPAARSEAGIVIHNDSIFMFGGIAYDGQGNQSPVDYNDLWRYDLKTYTWEKLLPLDNSQPLPPTRFSHSVTILQDEHKSYLLVYSGRHLVFSSWTLLDDVWAYDFESNIWISITLSAGAPRAYTSLVTTQGLNMWFFGGYFKMQQSSNGYVYDDIVLGKFDMKDLTMETRRAVIASTSVTPLLRYNHQASLWRGDSMVIYGGSYQSDLGDVWAFNTTNTVTIDAGANTLPLSAETLIYVLGAFIFVIVTVLAISFLHWRRVDRRNVHAAHMRGIAVVHGVTSKRMEQLKITKYCRAERNTEVLRTGQSNPIEGGLPENDDICPICLIEFEDGEDVRNLPCKHIFHVACIDEWLKRNTSCPMCKSDVDLDAVNVSVDTSRVASRGSAVVTPISTGP